MAPRSRPPAPQPDPPPAAWLPAWDGAAYAANTAHHRRHDAWFLERFPVRPADRILDLGCGAGDFTRVVADLVPDGHVLGLDAQPSMVAEAARVAGANQDFLVAPVQALDEVLGTAGGRDGTFDAVMSRAVLHWVPADDQPAVYAAAFRLLRPGGFLRIECGGAGNIPHTRALLDDISARHGGPTAPWHFADAGTALDRAEQAGFTVEPDGYVHTVAQHRRYDREAYRGWLHSQVIEAYRDGIDPARRDAFTAEVEARLDEMRRPGGSYDQTYVRLDLLVRKPS
jgi:trans-aconitate methyltransferase